MKNVLVFKSALLPYSETFIKEQILALTGWQATLLGMARVPGLSLDGLDVQLVRPEKPSFLDGTSWFINQKLGQWPKYAVDQVKEREYKLIHAHFGTDALLVWPLAKKLGLPLLVTLHGFDININPEWWESGRAGRSMKKYPRRLVSLAEHGVKFVAVSEAIKRRAIDFGLPEEAISVHYIGVDRQQFKPNGCPLVERPRRILFVGRLVEKKGCEYLIRSFAALYPLMPDSQLHVVGDGPLRKDLENLARQLRAPVTFLGALNSTQVREQMYEARVFCLPSITAENGDAEGLPISILEAQACGLPVITSAHGGSTEGVLPGLTGFAVAEKDVESLREHLRQVLMDDELALSMSRRAQLLVAETFDLQRCTAKLEQHYDMMTHYV